MKTLIVLIAASFISFGSLPDKSKGPEMYCVTLKDGKAVVEYNGEVVTKEIKLKDGTLIKADGTVITDDGKELKLKNGECVDPDGVLTLLRERTRPQ
jgi:hypothetical protein